MKNNSQKSSPLLLCASTTKLHQSVPQICKFPKSRSSDTAWLTTHRQFTEYGRNAKEWMRKCALLLPQIGRQQIWRKKRFHSIYDYAAKLAGINRDQVNDALRIVGKAEYLPALKEVISIKGLNAVRPIIAIATKENQQFLAEKAMTMSKNTLETFVRHFRKGEVVNLQIEGRPSTSAQSVNLQIGHQGDLDFHDVTKIQSANLQIDTNSPHQQFALKIQPPEFQKVTLILQLDPQIADQLQKLKGQGDWNGLMKEFLKLKREKLEENKPAIVEVKTKFTIKTSNTSQIQATKALNPNTITTFTPKNSQTTHITRHIGHSRTIPAAIKRHVLAKTNSTCAFPGCTKSYKILHHTNRFAQYHTHDPDKIFSLCEAHERLAHLGLIENENQPAENWKLRARPDYDDPKYEVDRMVEKYRSKQQQG